MSRHASLLPISYARTIEDWLAEDIPSFDYGGYVVGDDVKVATLYCKSPGVLAGKPFFNEVFRQTGCTVSWSFEEGVEILPNEGKVVVAEVTGPGRRILMGERVALNILARCSGIASRARRLRTLADQNNFNGVVAGTRKTTPGFRLVEKYGMQVGGADTHRMDLSSMVMLKDNHIWATGSITRAVAEARAVAGFSIKIEVECQSETDAMEAIDAGADIVMLDNFKPEQLAVAAQSIKAKCQSFQKQVLIEASGGITEDTAAQYMGPGVDIISFGSMTQGVPHVDFSLKIAH
ncbi:nicotinate-nucleotide diphosphorylase (carboxylating) [Coemansia sp. RSA 2523]|nr:nicotinate-nucleotide diphosphorylase (carboxylating) [Coemansia sp. RSA 1591]KAJ1755010.1 nicotinate-nucleotide diphosphorylase (carboxylating) [Coemansia sp. RSA 1752]KAJ1775395.1 nicotinate-nucleotide diphosphorylase (carboxylating) [Coemansia sp. RSA 1824]KAJ1782275.1 nicotinate-nucleotide diphosphorylase (carboxylating) [Coemansia sp. RSA 1938]KAJ1783348.1 nicotinate-nucleotide diphosphorylase (carboxylating) [Coemansia sp. RSA 2167]KAJ1811446.1 nicotinate-nucleotide diphosphorylase (c